MEMQRKLLRVDPPVVGAAPNLDAEEEPEVDDVELEDGEAVLATLNNSMENAMKGVEAIVQALYVHRQQGWHPLLSVADDAMLDPGLPSVEALRCEVEDLLEEKHSHCIVDGVERYGIFQGRGKDYHYLFLSKIGVITENAVGAYSKGYGGIYRAVNVPSNCTCVKCRDVSAYAQQWMNCLRQSIARIRVAMDAKVSKVQAGVEAAKESHIAGQRIAADTTTAHALLEHSLQMELLRLEFLEGSLQELKNKVLVMTLKLEEELGSWYNTIKDSLRYSGYQAASKHAVTLQNLAPDVGGPLQMVNVEP